MCALAAPSDRQHRQPHHNEDENEDPDRRPNFTNRKRTAFATIASLSTSSSDEQDEEQRQAAAAAAVASSNPSLPGSTARRHNFANRKRRTPTASICSLGTSPTGGPGRADDIKIPLHSSTSEPPPKAEELVKPADQAGVELSPVPVGEATAASTTETPPEAGVADVPFAEDGQAAETNNEQSLTVPNGKDASLMPPASPRAPTLSLLSDENLAQPVAVSQEANEGQESSAESAVEQAQDVPDDIDTVPIESLQDGGEGRPEDEPDPLGDITEQASSLSLTQMVSGPAAPNGGQYQAATAENSSAIEADPTEGEPQQTTGQLSIGQQQEQHEQQQGINGPTQNHQGPLDSITLGQLRNLVGYQRPKARQYAFPADADCDELAREIDEFFSYVEAPQVAENRAAWEEWCSLTSNQTGDKGTGASKAPVDKDAGAQGKDDEGGALGLGLGLGLDLDTGKGAKESASEAKSSGEWTSLPTSARRRRIQALLALLEVREPEARQRASRALLYLLQGSFADTSGPEHQLQWMLENARMVRAAGGLGDIYAAFRIANWKHEWLSSLPDHIPSSEATAEGPAPPLMTPEAKLDYLDEINLELALHFAQLYILVEAHRGETEWGEELMALDPPLPIYLFAQVASLREKNSNKGYPVKKLLLLLWKSMLACLGGLKDASRGKELARELEGLPREAKDLKPVVTKATPVELQTFQEETLVKYPTFVPPKKTTGELPTESIASAITPIPPRKPLGQGEGGAATPFPGTPAPSPPPSPKTNKQRYQTNQRQPFVFPYSRSVQGARMVPYSIEEAARLYRENMHVGLELWQIWRLREQCIHEESGVASAADGRRVGLGSYEPLEGSPKFFPSSRNGDFSASAAATIAAEGSSQGSRSPSTTEGPGSHTTSGGKTARQGGQSFRSRGEPTLDRLYALEAELSAELLRVENDHMLAVLDNDRYMQTIESLQQKRADTKRLQYVDILYRSVLPYLQSSIIVLLKLLLATVTQQNSTNSAHFQALAEGVTFDEAPPPTLEDIDIVRHREITSKAVSAILLLTLKWFKASHAMKFHYVSQLLVDSNCLLLILKMFGLQEVASTVKSKNEAPAFNFFRYCELNCGKEPRQPRPEDAQLAPQPYAGTNSPTGGGFATLNSMAGAEDVELLHDYSFRNFFSALNFTRILQKLTKRKVHRILLLVQYKSSAILKRTLKVAHPALQIYVLKVIKSQVPYCGRKWRQGNMKVITAIYLNCRPDLRDEWLAGSDVDADVEDSLPHEQALRALVKYYNATRVGPNATVAPSHGQAHGHGHKRSLSTNLVPGGGPGAGETGSPDGGVESALAAGRNAGLSNNDQPQQQQQMQLQHGGAAGGLSNVPSGLLSPGRTSFFESDILPPLRRGTERTAGTMRYIPDDLLEGYLDEYEDVLGEVFGEEYRLTENQWQSQQGDLSSSSAASTGQEIGGPEGHKDREEKREAGQGDDGEGADAGPSVPLSGSHEAAWARLGEILGDADSISDSESIASIGDLSGKNHQGGTDPAIDSRRVDDNREKRDGDGDGDGEGNEATWESLSPQAMKFLMTSSSSSGGNSSSRPGSPKVQKRTSMELSPSRPGFLAGHHRRSSSSGSSNGSASGRKSRQNSENGAALRPVLSFGPELLNDDVVDEQESEDRLGEGYGEEGDGDNEENHGPPPQPKAGGIDEVEHIWNL